ncbi:MAG: RNA polymerase sigma factor [Nitrospiria bacterium]
MGIDIIQTITQCLQGDENGWNMFANEYVPIARKILNKFQTLSSEDRDNIIQNVLIKLLERGFSQFRGRTRYEFLAFYKMVVENEGKDYLKSENRRNGKLVDFNPAPSESEEIFSEHSDGLDGLESPTALPDKVSEQKELLKMIDHLLQQYSLSDQQLFLYKTKGYQDKEISELMEIPMGTVASRYARMVERVKEGFKKEGVETFL